MRISDWSSDVVLFRSRPTHNSAFAASGGTDTTVHTRPRLRLAWKLPPVPLWCSVLLAGLYLPCQKGKKIGGNERSQSWQDRKSVVQGKSVTVRVDLGGSRIIKKKKKKEQ